MKYKHSRILIYAAMAIVLILKLGVIRKLSELSLWPDMTFYTDLGMQPGVVLPILGSVLTQISGIPILGVALVLLSLCCLSLIVRGFQHDGITAIFPTFAAFWFIAGFDYSLYTFRSQGLLFSQTLGLICAALMILGWIKIKEYKEAPFYPLLVALAGYPLFGAYSVVALAAILLDAIVSKKWLPAALAVVCGFCVPLAYSHFVFTHIDTRYTFLAGLPYMDFVDNHRRFIPLAISMASLVILPVIRIKRDPGGAVTWVLTVLMALIIVSVLPYRNRNFHIEIAMQHAIEKNDWDKALKLARRTGQPSRIIVMYRNIALMNKGRLCDEMFTFPNESVGIDTPAQISQTEVCGPLVFFYNGLINYSARWSWEMSMMFQRTVERYKYQAKVALFTGQEKPALVEKYLDIIARNLYQRKWVRGYRSMLEDPSLLASDPEYKMFKALDNYEEIKYMSSAVVENTILNHFMLQEHPEGVMLEASLAASMTAKDIDMFWYFFDILLASGRRIPTHVAEAAILFAYIGRDQAEIDAVARSLGGPDAPVVRRFIDFSSKASSGDEKACRDKFMDTYWYYVYFVKSITTD